VQTFLPYPEFDRSAKVLDRQRLGKQRVEVLQIITTLVTHRNAWKNHPATMMWRGHEAMLALYGDAICSEWISRGYQDTCRDKINKLVIGKPLSTPEWLGRLDFHASHRSNLLRKSPEHYGQFGWSEPDNLPYIWPILNNT
jgi:hypothetical protein